MTKGRRRGLGQIPSTETIQHRVEALKRKLAEAEILLRVAQELDAVDRNDQGRKVNEGQLCAN